jgi:rhamnulose-1-phosphate aldolase/alcohol dehydrogenase
MPENLWRDEDAAKLPDLEGLVYRSRLLGADRSLINIYGGNTSSKLTVEDHLGRPTRVLYVKGSGSDVADIADKHFAALKLDEILPLRERDSMTDEEMVEFLARVVFEPGRPRQSIEALLHAFLPAKCVDHSHPDAIISIACAPGGKEMTRDLYGGRVAWVDYTRPGFLMSKWIADAADSGPNVEGVVMAKHGFVTWGPDSKTSYSNTVRLVSEAAEYIEHRKEGRAVFGGLDVRAMQPGERQQTAAAVLPEVRGLVSKRKRQIVFFDDGDDVLAYAGTAAARDLSQVGAACPDHLVHTKRQPLFVDWRPDNGVEALRAALAEGLADYEKRYQAYFDEHKSAGDEPADPAPRVVIVAGVGLFAVGKDAKAAEVTRQLAHRAIAAIEGSVALGGFISLDAKESFEIEYWPLELYKLKLAPPPRELAGRVAFVAGGASGIGRATARRLAQEGAHVVVADLNAEGASEVARELEGKHGERRAISLACDVTDEASVAAAFEQTALSFGGVDVVVNSAGIASSAPVEDTTLKEWDRNQSILSTGYFLVAREAFRVLKRQGTGGSMVFITSKNSVAAGRNASAYSAAKAAEMHLARCLAEEGGPHGIRVNCVMPDAVLQGSSIWQGQWRKERAEAYGIAPEELEEHYRKRTTLKLSVFPEDIAEAVLFFASDRSAKTTGGALTVDAGVPAAYLR